MAQKEMRSMEGRGRPARVSRPSLPLASSLISGVNPGHLFCGSGAVRDVARPVRPHIGLALGGNGGGGVGRGEGGLPIVRERAAGNLETTKQTRFRRWRVGAKEGG